MKLIDKIEFDKLTQNEKRVAICNDVISRIDAENIVANHGRFFNNQEYIADHCSVPVQEQINKIACHVCAKGAVFCSWVGNFNNVNHNQLMYVAEDTRSLSRYVPELVEIFGVEMLDNLEAAFEGESYYWHYNEDETQRYADAFRGYKLRDIMEYIVANKGEFPLPA